MSIPSSDSAAIRQTIRALKAAGYTLDTVFDGGETLTVTNEREAIDAITAVGVAYLYVHMDGYARGPWVQFVLGNSPDEVICDYTVSLESVIDPLVDSWV